MYKNLFIKFSYTFIIILLLIIPVFNVLGSTRDEIRGYLEGGGSHAGYTTGTATPSLPSTIALLIRVALSLLGIICLVLIVFAGYLWMTAGGNDEQIKKAKNLMINSAIGAAIILSAYSISTFILRSVQGTGIYGSAGGTGRVGSIGDTASGAFNRGVDSVRNFFSSPPAVQLNSNPTLNTLPGAGGLQTTVPGPQIPSVNLQDSLQPPPSGLQLPGPSLNTSF